MENHEADMIMTLLIHINQHIIKIKIIFAYIYKTKVHSTMMICRPHSEKIWTS